jgi:hypothetical protein
MSRKKAEVVATRVQISISVTPDELIDGFLLSGRGEEATFDFIKALDLGMASYDFTLRVARHLVAELEKECRQDGESFDMTELTQPKSD